MSKEAILNSAKSALQSNKLKDAVREYGGEIKHGKDTLIDEYIAMQSANKGIIVESSDLTADLAQILRDLGSKSNIYAKNAESFIAPLKDEFNLTAYDKSVDEIRDTLFSTDTAIIKAECGIADIGVFGVASSADNPRLASLITKNCIVILEKKNIVKSIKDGIAKLRGENLPSNMILIAGPSRTADIELKTVFGVHGPQVVYIILV
ncbi:LutC/YkgG family protein [Helicobacter sp. 23-1044]